MKTLIITNLNYSSKFRSSIMHCAYYNYTVDNIVSISADFDKVFVVNDLHTKDDIEFNYVPPHGLDISLAQGVNCSSLDEEGFKKLHVKTQILYKDTFSAVQKRHNKEVILKGDPDLIVVAGFNASLDVTPTVLDLCQEHNNVRIYPYGISDLTLDLKSRCIGYMNYIGIKTYEST